MTYDLIGDIHGHAETLVTLLRELGYRQRQGVFRHGSADRIAVFLGDFIDRGPHVRDTLAIVRAMMDAGAARSVMGNHEYNAICFHTRQDEAAGGQGWLRPRSDKNVFQHIDTLYQFRRRRSELSEYVEWFMTLPLYLELDGLRVVHAAWKSRAAETCRRYSNAGNVLTRDFLFASIYRNSEEFAAVETMLKGVEIELPSGAEYLDKDGNPRTNIRVAWWEDAHGRTYRSVMFPRVAVRGSDDDPLGEVVPEREAAKVPGYSDAMPIFVGHYWLPTGVSAVQSRTVCCLDFSVAKGGHLAAYTWSGESELDARKVTMVVGPGRGEEHR